MRDSRKTFLNVLFDNLINLLDLSIIGLLIYFVIQKDFLYIIPLSIAVVALVFKIVLAIIFKVKNVKPSFIHVLRNENECEKPTSSLKRGDDVVVYPADVIDFVGVIRRGNIFVDESRINGSTAFVKKSVGDYVKRGSIVCEGSAVINVEDTSSHVNSRTRVQEPRIKNVLRIINTITVASAIILVLTNYLIDKDSLNSALRTSLLCVPLFFNLVISLFSFITIQRYKKEDLTLLDPLVISELDKIDVLCLDKTGTITSNEFEVFKKVTIMPTSFSVMGADTARAFDLLVSSIIKTTNEKGILYTALREHFIYDVTKIVKDSSSIKDNGRYSAITLNNGKTYALGEPENFEISNTQSAYNFINEYRSNGYHVLLIVESKKPLNSGLIDGKSSGIGIIVLQEKMRESVKSMIDYCLSHNKQIKIISGDDFLIVNEVARKLDIESQGNVVNLDRMSEEELLPLIEERSTFSNALASQKSFIISELQKRGHKVMYIGDGDNDAKALKSANVAMTFADATMVAKKCSQIILGDNASIKEETVKDFEKNSDKLMHVLSILYSQAFFGILISICFTIWKLFEKTIVNPFEYHHLFLWTILGVLLPIIYLLVKSNASLTKKYKLSTMLLLDTLLFTIPIIVLFVLQTLQRNSIGFYGLPSDYTSDHVQLATSQVTNNISYLVLMILGFGSMYHHFQQAKVIDYVVFVIALVFPLAYIVLLVLGLDSLSVITQIETSNITIGNYFTGAIASVAAIASYLLILSVINIVKGDK